MYSVITANLIVAISYPAQVKVFHVDDAEPGELGRDVLECVRKDQKYDAVVGL